ncbi:MAG: ribosome small subunit-dependent GTPase A [Bacteroidales bacterium]
MQAEKKGRIIKSTGRWYQVKAEDGNCYNCSLKGTFRIKGIKTTNPLAIGDKVYFSLKDSDNGVITKYEPRTNYIIRKSTKLSKQTHILAANIDQAMLIATLAYPRTSTGFIDRFLVTAEAYHIPAKIVIHKTDIYDEKQLQIAKQLTDVYEDAGYETLCTSIYSKPALEELSGMLNNRLTLIAGHSGVGKSALLNKLSPGLKLKTGELSNTHQKGKHTTTFATMLELWPNTWVIDTPGIKEFGLVDMEKDEIRLYFPEMMRLAENCRFYNCTHVHEPGCAVKKAVENKTIADFRYKNYLNLREGKEMNMNPWELK